MKRLTSLCLKLIVLMEFSCSCSKTGCPLLVGSFTKGSEEGLCLFNFYEQDGSFTLVSKADAGVSPAYFCFSEERGMIYTINEVDQFRGTDKSGGLTTLKYDKRSGKIEKLNEMSVPNGGPCFISVSSGNDFLFIANYNGGSAAVVRLDKNGIPEMITDTIYYENIGEKVPHAHMIMQEPLGGKVYLTDLGLDRVMIYDLDKNTGRLKPFRNPAVYLPEGAGPRHFVFNKTGTKMYLINELNSTIVVLDVDANEGLKISQTVQTVSKDFQGKNYCADIHIGIGGDFLYGSNRGENSIVTYAIGRDGLIEPAGRTSCGGDWPRNFVIDPSGKYLLAGNQKSDNISILKIDPETGIPQPHGTDVKVTAPACLKFP